MNKFSRPKRFIFIPIMAIAAIGIISGIVMLLWNNILPDVFGIRAITYWQSMGILVLSKILFGFKGGRPGWGRHHGWGRNMHEKLANMTPEERDNFKEQWARRAAEWHGHPRCYPGGPTQPDNKEQQGQ